MNIFDNISVLRISKSLLTFILLQLGPGGRPGLGSDVLFRQGPGSEKRPGPAPRPYRPAPTAAIGRGWGPG